MTIGKSYIKDFAPEKLGLVLVACAALLFSVSAMYGFGESWFFSETKFLWYSHVGLVILFVALVLFSNIFKRLLCGFFDNTGGLLLFLFFFHLCTSVFRCPDSDIVSSRLAAISQHMLPGFLLGIIAFGDIRFVAIYPKFFESKILLKILICLLFIFTLLFLKNTFAMLISLPIKSQALVLEIENNTAYQGFSMYGLTAYCLVLTFFLKFHKRLYASYLTHQLLFLFLLGITALFSFIIALAGSKKEVLAIFLLFMSYNIYFSFRLSFSGKFKLRFLQVFSVLVPLLFCGFFLYFSGWTLSLPSLKVLDYGAGINTSSFFSRIDVLKSVGVLQLQDSPIFGNIGVEFAYGGPGYYIHSLISVQSHLGLVGSFFLFGYLWHRLRRLYRFSDGAELKILAPVIIFVCFISSFFSWFPLWVLIGGLFIPVFIKQKSFIKNNVCI